MPHTPSDTAERKIYPTNANDYDLKEEIGQGTSAKVYMARCIPFNEVVAIKCLDLEKSNIDMDDIRKEIHLITTIVHPNVVRAHCSFIKDSFLWVVMPFMSGGSCLHIMKFMYPDGLEEIVIATILKETLKALDFIHRQGHIHRDVKAGNILIDSTGHVKVADFGVAACMFDAGDRQRSRNTFVGTPCWMAPEVMEQLHGYDFKADIWSFGITALELAHGHAPFSKYPPMKVLLMTLQNAPPTLSSEREKKFSKSFKEMIAMCLVKDPQKRPSAEKLLKHSFFKQAKSSEYVSKHLLEGLPPLSDREKVLKSKDEVRLAAKKIPSDVQEEMSQNEYKRGVSSWNFNVEDLKKQAALMKDDEDDVAHSTIKEEDESIMTSPGLPRVKSKRDSMEESHSGPLTSPLNASKPENIFPPAQHIPIPIPNQSLTSQSSSQNLLSKSSELPPIDPKFPRNATVSTSSKTLSKSQGSTSKKEPISIGRFVINDDDDDSWHDDHQYKSKFSSSQSMLTMPSSSSTNSLPTFPKSESVKEISVKTEEKKEKEREKEKEKESEKEKDGNFSSDSDHGGSHELKKLNMPAQLETASSVKIPFSRSSPRLSEEDRTTEKTDEASRDRRPTIITTQSTKDLTLEEKNKTSEKIQKIGRFSVISDSDLSDEAHPHPHIRRSSVHVQSNKPPPIENLTIGSAPNSQPMTPVSSSSSSTINGSMVSLSIVIPHLQNLLKHITEQQDVVFNLLCSLSPSDQGSKSSRSASAFANEFGIDIPCEKERELMLQVVDLQARVASLEKSESELKVKNSQLERQLNVYVNKEQEEKIRKEEAAREDS